MNKATFILETARTTCRGDDSRAACTNFNFTRATAVVSFLFFLNGCAGIPTNIPRTGHIPHKPIIPADLPDDAAKHDPAIQHTLMSRGLYLDASGNIRSLASEEQITGPEPIPAAGTQRKNNENQTERRFEPVLLPIPNRKHD